MQNDTPGRMVAALGWDGGVRILAVVVDGPADEVRRRHELDRGAAKRAAEGVVAAALLAAHVKGEERLTVDVASESPAFAFVCDVNGDGTLRARFRPGRFGFAARFTGIVAVLKSLGRHELYRGYIEVRDETFEDALQRYLTESQQVDARARLGANVDKDDVVRFASGLLVERMPGMDPDTFRDEVLPALTGDLGELMDGFAFGTLGGRPLEVLGSAELRFQCTCSRDRVLATIRALGAAEIRQVLVDPGHAEVTCHFCNERYLVGADELHAMLGELAD